MERSTKVGLAVFMACTTIFIIVFAFVLHNINSKVDYFVEKTDEILNYKEQHELLTDWQNSAISELNLRVFGY